MNSKLAGYYEELGVQPDASSEEIREAYRRLAKKYHPDTNRGDKVAEERFKRIGEAYRVLSDPAKRIVYHKKEEVRTKARSAAKSKSTTQFSDLFKKVFRGGFGAEGEEETAQVPRRGKDQQITLELDTLELAAGVKKTIQVKRDVTCTVCGGTGLKPGYEAGQCTVCKGLGEVPTSRGGKTVFVSCPNCKGSGKVAKEPCLHCGGRSVQKGSVKITVDVPAGTASDAVLTIRGQGNAGLYGGKPGDLKVQIHESTHAYFSTEGSNLVYELPLTLLEALAGTEVEIPTRDGKVKLTLTPGLNPDKPLRIKGKGVEKEGGGYGDLLVRIRYVIPDRLGDRARKILEELVKLPEWKVKKDKRGFVPRGK